MALLLGVCLLLAAVAGLITVMRARERRKVRERRAERQHRLHRDWWVWTWFSRSSRHKRLTYDPRSGRK